MRRVQLRGGARRQPARRTCCTLSRLPRAPTKQMGPYHRSGSLSEKTGESDEKGSAARRRPKAAGEAYLLYVEPAAEGANEADGPLSSLSLEVDLLAGLRLVPLLVVVLVEDQALI